MKKAIGARLLLSIVGLTMIAGRLGAQNGEVVYTYGEVVLLRDSHTHNADIGMPVQRGDVIETAAESLAIISLTNGTELKLRENTSLSLDSLGRSASVHLAAGSVFSRVSKALAGRYSVKTETAIMGVRGTEFFVAYGRRIDKNPDIWVCVNSGSVEVGVLESRETLIVEEGKGTNIVGGTTLTKPKRYPWTRKLNWNMDPERGDAVDRTDLEQAYSDLLDQDYD